MNKKNVLKLLLDIVMIVVLVLMYSKRAISMSFHEIGGLVLLGVFVIHMIINYKWVVTVTKRLFRKSLPIRTRISYVLNILLLISFILVGVSGVFISKIVFHISVQSSINWKTIHFAAASWALVFIGVHVGLHFNFITGMLKKILPLPQKIGRVIGILLTVIVVTYGCYSFNSHSFYSWMIMPFTNQESGGAPDFKQSGNSGAADNQQGSGETADNQQQGKGGAPSGQHQGSGGAPNGQQQGNGGTANSQQGNWNKQGESGGMPSGQQEGGIQSALSTLIDYFSISMVFAAITVVISKLLQKKKKNNNIGKSASTVSKVSQVAQVEAIAIEESGENKEEKNKIEELDKSQE